MTTQHDDALAARLDAVEDELARVQELAERVTAASKAKATERDYNRAIAELPEPIKSIIIRVLMNPDDPEALAALEAAHAETFG